MTKKRIKCKRFAKGVRLYFPMEKEVEMETKVHYFRKRISIRNYVAGVMFECNMQEKQCCMTFRFLNPVPITTDEEFDDFLDYYFKLFEGEASIVMVSAKDGSESEYALWDLKDCTCQWELH